MRRKMSSNLADSFASLHTTGSAPARRGPRAQDDALHAQYIARVESVVGPLSREERGIVTDAFRCRLHWHVAERNVRVFRHVPAPTGRRGCIECGCVGHHDRHCVRVS